MGLQVRTGVIFVAEKRLQRLFYRVAAVFCFFADQLNIAFSMRPGDPVRIRNNRPLLCLAPPLPSVREPAVSIGFFTL